jgi:hypothetical protein
VVVLNERRREAALAEAVHAESLAEEPAGIVVYGQFDEGDPEFEADDLHGMPRAQ